MPDVLQKTFSVEVEKATYEFKIPGIATDIEVGYRAAAVRRKIYPESGGALGAVDFSAVQLSRYFAYLELYLVRTSALWPYGFDDSDVSKLDPSSPPKVDFEKFPSDCIDLVYQVGAAFEQEVARFRRRGNPDGSPAGA